MTTRPISYAALVQPNRTLQDIMNSIASWEGDKPAVIHQAVWRGLVKRLAQLEKEGITYGLLDASQISIYHDSKVTILNEPKENDFEQPKFKEAIKPLITKVFEVPALNNNLECQDFLRRIRNDGNGFGELESHPFLLSYEEKAYSLLEAVNKLNNYNRNWQEDYRSEVKDFKIISEVVRDEKGYSDVFHHKEYGTYEDNALGALLYSRNVVAHIEEYFQGNEKPPSKGEVGKRLSEFFPNMMLGLYEFMVRCGMDTGSEPRQINLNSYIS